VLVVSLVYLLRVGDQPKIEGKRIVVAKALSGGDTTGFARALEPRCFNFPDDHGPHPAYKHEWWYYTGNLRGEDGRHFGFQLTFFRISLSPETALRDSKWATNQIYMAHFTVTDVSGKRFYSFERFSRAALGLAGAKDHPFRVWLEDWSAEGLAGRDLPMHLRASQADVTIDLILESAKPIVLQGDRGLSRKSSEPGNASYYYSLTRLPTNGTMRIGAEAFEVEGLSWLDREWGTSALGKEQVGWDWFALQLSDGREVMFYQLRRKDGSADPWSSAVLIFADGSSRTLSLEEMQIEVLNTWQSPHSFVHYPSHWRLSIPAESLTLDITPYLADQELKTSVRYWEGAVSIRGTSQGKAIHGNGYVELTGYGEEG
jgi:predicted secreted hydrolase